MLLPACHHHWPKLMRLARIINVPNLLWCSARQQLSKRTAHTQLNSNHIHIRRMATTAFDANSPSESTTAVNPTIPNTIPLLKRLNLRTRKRFAPLNPEIPNPTNAPPLRGIVFDVDGTLCEPQNWMFRQMRLALSIDKSVDILNHIHSLPSNTAAAAMEQIKSIERSAMVKMVPQPGLLTLMQYLESRGIQKAICTRNFDTPVAHLMENFMPGLKFHPIITRAFKPPKPHPAGINFIARNWGLEEDEEGSGKWGRGLIMVGDSLDDMRAGRGAGAATVLLLNKENEDLVGDECTDCVVERLDDLIHILENGFEEIDRTGEGKKEPSEAV